MKQPVYLKSFEYSIPASETNFHDRANVYGEYLEMRLPLVKVNIDFENKYLILESNGMRGKSISSKTELTCFAFAKERIKVNANIYCGLDINLSGSAGDDLVFFLEGIVDDGESRNACSGLIVISKRINVHESGGKEWDLRISLYDNNNDEREIKLVQAFLRRQCFFGVHIKKH